jgi:hypothetical protein
VVIDDDGGQDILSNGEARQDCPDGLHKPVLVDI